MSSVGLRTLVGALLVSLLLATTAGCPSFHRGAMPGEPKNASYAAIEDARVRYVDRGEGPPVVLLHGFASALETWSGVMPLLEKSHRVVALDLKGFGWTDRPEGDYSPDAQAKLVLGLLDRLGIERATVVAHSWGCSVALAMALRAPERVSRLALYDAWIYEEQLPSMFAWARTEGIGELLFALFYKERPDEKMAMAFYDPTLLDEPFVEEVEAAMDRPGTVAAALAAVRGQRSFEEAGARYHTIRQPVLLLWGREDRVTHLDFGERLASDLPDARLRVYPRCGHFPMIEAAGASTRDLLAFLGDAKDAQEPARAKAEPDERPARDGTTAPSLPAGLPSASPPDDAGSETAPDAPPAPAPEPGGPPGAARTPPRAPTGSTGGRGEETRP